VLDSLRAQTHDVADLREVVITHDGWLDEHRATIEHALGRAVRLVAHAADVDYYGAKNAGFDATDADVVVFADSDCVPEPQWLAALVAPLLDPDAGVGVVAGRTSYRDGVLGRGLSAIDFMYFPSDHGPRCRRNFYANNVAFRREVFASRRYRVVPEIYRGPCQALGMALHAESVPLHFAPDAHTVHRFPDSWRELAALRWLRGGDTTEMAPAIAEAAGVHPAWIRRLGPALPLAVLGGRLRYSLAATMASRARWTLRGDPRALSGSRWASAGVVVGVTALDAAGAMGRVIAGRRREASRRVLSYHAEASRPRTTP
jgi:glycosyltransferase involved in cell wall biosynthesis